MLGNRRVAFEVGAGQFVQDEVEFGTKEVLPAGVQVAEERLAMVQQAVKAAIEVVLGGEGWVIAEKVGHGTSGESDRQETVVLRKSGVPLEPPRVATKAVF